MGTFDNPFEFDFDSYIREVEPSKQEKIYTKQLKCVCFCNRESSI